MKPIKEFLTDLRHLDVKLWIDGDKLRYRAAKDSLEPSLRAQLRERKPEILTFLRQADAVLKSSTPPIQAVSREADLPLSFAQQRLWFLSQLDPGSAVYNLPPAVYRLRGILNVTTLKQSLREIVLRHESLRTTFPEIDGRPRQVVAPENTLILSQVDLQTLSSDQQESAVEHQASLEAQQLFDLAQGPLLRAKLLRLGAEEHVLLITMHHIVSDAWSLNIFFRELTALYTAFSKNQASPLSKLLIHYGDFAVWQRQWLQGDVLASQLDFWKQQLTGQLPALELPTDRPRPPVQSYRGNYQTRELPKALKTALNALSQREDVTLFMTLLAAFQTLLHRYCGQDDIIVGSPVAGRNWVETEGLIGFFVNNLALRTDLGGNPSFRELLANVRKTTLAAYNHQDLPFEKLVEELLPKRDPSRSPLFQVSFSFQNFSSSPNWTLPGLSVNPVNFRSKALQYNVARLDLSLYLEESADGLRVWFEYNTDLFDDATITRMLGHFQTLLEGIVANPDQQLSDLPLLTSVECHQLLVEWDHTQADDPHDHCIHQLFEAQVEQTPDTVALIFADGHNPMSEAADTQLTYRQLNSQANQLAHHLQALGVGPGDLVGLCLERSIEMIVSLLAVLKAGAAYVPLDPTYPRERLAYMLSDAQASVLLTQQRLLTQLPQVQSQIICLDVSRADIAQAVGTNPISVVKPDNLAYVIYTSGSTGKPKGVLIAHQGLCNLAHAQIQLFDVQPASRVLQFASLSFDAAISEIVMALCSGATLCLANQEALLPGPNLIQLLQQQAITHLTLPPSALAALPQASLPALQSLIVAGEPCPPNLARQWSQHRRFFNAYGPSEATVCATVADCTEITGQRLPIGRAIANTHIYILDRHLQPVPIGVPGELHISGVGLAQGYLNQPELTAETFIPNPFLGGIRQEERQKAEGRRQEERQKAEGRRQEERQKAEGRRQKVEGKAEDRIQVLGVRSQESESRIQDPEPPPSPHHPITPSPLSASPHLPHHPITPLRVPASPRLYKTGDLARYLPNGNIEFLGRIDHQVKVRGFRIELGEIEAVLSQHSAVQQAAVIVREEALDDQRLVAFVVPNSYQTMTSDELRRFLKQHLPDYMTPGSFTLLEALPLTPNGKIDRRTLSSSDWGQSELSDSVVTPRTPVEQQLADIWAQVLKLDQVDIHDDFFDLGGHSLLATQVMSRVVQAFSVDISLQTLFKFPTVAKLAEHIETLRWMTEDSPEASADQVEELWEIL